MEKSNWTLKEGDVKSLSFPIVFPPSFLLGAVIVSVRFWAKNTVIYFDDIWQNFAYILYILQVWMFKSPSFPPRRIHHTPKEPGFASYLLQPSCIKTLNIAAVLLMDTFLLMSSLSSRVKTRGPMLSRKKHRLDLVQFYIAFWNLLVGSTFSRRIPGANEGLLPNSLLKNIKNTMSSWWLSSGW